MTSRTIKEGCIHPWTMHIPSLDVKAQMEVGSLKEGEVFNMGKLTSNLVQWYYGKHQPLGEKLLGEKQCH